MHELIANYARPTMSLDREEDEEVARLAVILKHSMFAKARRFVEKYSRNPVLMSFSSDGTPMLTVKRFLDMILGKRKAHRQGGKNTELLVQRGFVKTIDASGVQEVCPMLCELVPLDLGKFALHVYSAALRFGPTLRQQGHVGIAINHYVADRALFSALELRFHQRHAQ